MDSTERAPVRLAWVHPLCAASQVMSDPAGGMTFVADPKKPVGGHVMAHASTQRIYMRKGKGEQRVAKVGTVCWLLRQWH